MSGGPLPSQLCLLSSLPYRTDGEKVRFLGCVLSYSTSSARLILGHDHPRDTNVTAVVDVRLILESLGYEDTRVGEWVNVVGYVKAKRRGRGPGAGGGGGLSVYVEAILVWPTGPLDVQRYEKTFEPDAI
ncbi:hypothetical protein GMORB2_1004 [Geosmithia morbida]|uniref:CST complex subunit Ten1 n=1 Tax=Geosmithia morbida TaxID=1094350 RepID=A0A9P4Z343_9HYPO|nr:uncharacterized protein GMORB2_1004 [Geosmithia morbida]KAF4125759.1 hypothetical protein GMORB2_1004 [Geosmithia morbida]